MENNDEIIRSPQELADRLAKAILNKEAFAINATFNSQRGVRSVFFIGGKIDMAMIKAQVESLNAMIFAVQGKAVEADSLIKQTDGSDFEKHADGSFTLKFKPNDQATK